MRVLIAPDSFKGSLSAPQVAEAIARGVAAADPDGQRVVVPLADGGEGTAEVLRDGLGGSWEAVETVDPLGRPLSAGVVRLDTGPVVVEAAKAIGHPLLLERERDPWRTSSAGLAWLLKAALLQRPAEIWVSLGGTATNDGGLGLLKALGARFQDPAGRPLDPVLGRLEEVAGIDLKPVQKALEGIRFKILVDVDNPLAGPRGATYTFGPQKGARPQDLEALDRELAHLGRLLEQACGRPVAELAGAGAAGGLGAALAAVSGAAPVYGIEAVLAAADFDVKARDADLVFTGEGRVDGQTLAGKVVMGVARRAQRYRLPVICLAGAVDPAAYPLYQRGVTAIFSIAPGPISLAEAMSRTGELLAAAAEAATRLWLRARQGLS